MTDNLLAEMNRLLAALRAGSRLCLCFDYDGTLVPFAERPELARLAPETRLLLEQLARQPRVSVGVLSGRSLDDLRRTIGLPGLYYAGTSGLELDFAGIRLVPPDATAGQALIARAALALAPIVKEYPGAWLEWKPLGLTLHYRAVAPAAIENLCMQAKQVLRSWVKDLRVLEGPMAIEATPALGWTKGTAVRMFGNYLGPDVALFYAGDSANDGDALEATAEWGGVAVGIGPRPPAAARHRLSDPATLTRWIAYLLGSLDPGSVPKGSTTQRPHPGPSPTGAYDETRTAARPKLIP